jgi:Leucine-rich repeat (LRR) protein
LFRYIQDISDGTFDGLIAQSLEELYITNSWLTRVPPSLQTLTKLKVLSIEKSRINFMPPGIFDGMTALEDLKISDGKVNEIGATTFNGLKNLKKLSLDKNEIK